MALDWNWLTGGIAVAALGGHFVQWLFRRPDANWLEKMKADIRRDVETSLTTHESRLRLENDLLLRVHDRSWQLLRDFLSAAFDARAAILDYAIEAAKSRVGDDVERAYERAFAAVSKVFALSAIAPPEHDAVSIANEFRAAFNAANEFTAPTIPMGPERGPHLMVVKATIDRGLRRTTTMAEAWNAGLWEATPRRAPSKPVDKLPEHGAAVDPELTDHTDR